MKKIFLLLVLPLLMATQCNEDDGVINYQTDYSIQNDTSVDLIYLTEDNQQIVIDSETSLVISSQIMFTDVSVLPSENNNITSVELFTLNDNEVLVSVYTQEPIADNLWSVTVPENFAYAYTLIVTDNLLY